MFDGFFTRIRTVMGLGAAHGKRGFPRKEHGIAIPVWGKPLAIEKRRVVTAGQDDATAIANVTPITISGAKSNG